MEPGFIIIIAIGALVLGILIGMFIGQHKADRRFKRDTEFTQGTLNIDNVDPEFEPSLYLSLGVPVEHVASKKYVRLDIKVMK